ncbi:DgyrCDS6761 [Dimorphilus gyrociliatus]|uniref:DgyrCDS6761 n=1 Tax=Dimorphilus gyrociliatus TaxID=2664684 RepID=A0A7I8VP01_9ANNE|nr:DgyrCDS6761 [Dimorphilus gyrociliatus]
MKIFVVLALALSAVYAAPRHSAVQLTTDTGFIVGGEDANRGDWPWQVSIQRCSISCSHNCGGTVLNGNWVLTAAHCITGAASSYRLVFGILNRDDETGGQVRTASRVTRHENWINDGSLGFPNDIGVVRFEEALDFSSPWVSPATLVSRGVGSLAGQACTITGWGRLFGGGPLPNTLQQAETRVLSNDECILRGISMARYEYHICISDDNDVNGACNGDSGGPLNCPVGPAGAHQIAGVTSFVIVGCRIDRPSGYVRVSEYLDWIDDNTN